jgi:hypothetical protein
MPGQYNLPVAEKIHIIYLVLQTARWRQNLPHGKNLGLCKALQNLLCVSEIAIPHSVLFLPFMVYQMPLTLSSQKASLQNKANECQQV